MGKQPQTVDAMLAEWRARGLDFSEGPTANLPEKAPETRANAISPGCAIRTLAADSDGVVVGVPPSVNNLFCSGREGRRFPSRDYKKWIKANASILASLGVVREYPVAVILTVECKLRAGRDLDNLDKAALDTMKKVGVLVDDDWRHVSKVTVEYRPCDGEGVRVTITKEKA